MKGSALTAAKLALLPEQRQPRRRKPAPVIDPHTAQVERAVASLELDFILCRDTGHEWTRFNARRIDADQVWEQTLRCKQCGTERHRTLSLRGAILESRYVYPTGYVMPAGIGRLSSSDRDSIRLRGVLEG
jgi:hypothetical protein